MIFETLFASFALGAMSFDEAKGLADKQEAALSPAQSHELVASQGRLVGPAFAACMAAITPPKPLPAFTIVMTLDGTGRVRRTWRQGESAFAQCVERQFATASLFTPPSNPFFTSFEYTSEP